MSDSFVCLVIIGFSIFFYLQTFSFPPILGYEKMGAEFWPRLNLIGMMILASIIMIISFRKPQKAVPTEVQPERKNTRGVITCGAFLLAFIILISYIGFLFSAFLSMMALIYTLGERNKAKIFFSSLILVSVIYLTFGKLLFVPIPRGISIFRQLSYYLY